MADFNFRWKNSGGNLPKLQPNFVDPMNTRIAAANPGASMEMGTPQASQQEFLQRISQPGASIMEKERKLADLERQLSEVDAEIAKIQTETVDSRKAVAAKLAEIGDTSLYQGMLSNEQNQAAQQRSNAAGIDNMLFEADKLSWGLDSKSDEERAIAKQTIKAQLDRAKQVAEQAGASLPAKYYELAQRLQVADTSSATRESERRRANELWLLARNKRLEKADIKEMEDYIAANPNSDISGQYRQLIEQYQGKTKEARGRAEKRKTDAKVLRDALVVLPAEEVTRRMRNLTAYERKLLEDFYPEMLK